MLVKKEGLFRTDFFGFATRKKTQIFLDKTETHQLFFHAFYVQTTGIVAVIVFNLGDFLDSEVGWGGRLIFDGVGAASATATMPA
jgi:hypothetical protein